MHMFNVHLKLCPFFTDIIVPLANQRCYVSRLMLCFLWIIFWLSKILSLCLDL